MNNYYELYAKFLNGFLKPKTKIKVVFDCSNGTAGLVLKPLLDKNKLADYELLNQAPDGRFPAHGPNPFSRKAKEELVRKVKLVRADLGVIFDADGDRSLFVDERGHEIDPDETGKLIITYLKPKKIVVDVATGWLTRIPSGRAKYRVIDSPVGGYYLKKIMREKSADLGIEHSGHYYFKNFYFSDSGILSSIFVMNAVSQLKFQGMSLSAWRKKLTRYYSIPERSVKVKNPRLTLNRFANYLKSKKGKVSMTDGVIFRNPDFWINVRRSRTEPLLRLNMEARSEKTLRRELKGLMRILRSR